MSERTCPVCSGTFPEKVRVCPVDGTPLARATTLEGWWIWALMLVVTLKYVILILRASNRGEVDYRALIAGRPPELARNPHGRFRLFRIGDAVASRNIHAAIYDALRLCIAI